MRWRLHISSRFSETVSAKKHPWITVRRLSSSGGLRPRQMHVWSNRPDATAHLVCAAVLREAYAMAKQMDEGEFDFLIVAKEIRSEIT